MCAAVLSILLHSSLFAQSDTTVTKKYTGAGTMDYNKVERESLRQLRLKVDSLNHKLDSLNLLNQVRIKEEKIERLNYLNNIVAPLIVALLSGTFTWIWALRTNRKRIAAAPKMYVEHLDNLIKNGVTEGVSSAVLNARAIVAARNSMRGSLTTISSQLNSEIDRLEAELSEVIVSPKTPSMSRPNTNDGSPEKIFETMQVLNKIWSARRTQIEVEMRKLLAEMGLQKV